MSLGLKSLENAHSDVIHGAISGNVADYFYNFETIEETRTWVENAVAQHRAGKKEEYVVFDGNEFIGMISPNFISKREAGIGIWIAESQHGKGYGKKSLEKLLEMLTERGVGEVHYETEPNNVASMRLAEALGFECILKDTKTVRYKKSLL